MSFGICLHRLCQLAVLGLVSPPAPTPAQAGGDAVALESSDWFAAVGEEIRSSEYRYGKVEGELGVWSAPNRSQELRSRITVRGIEVFPRSTTAAGVGAPWKLVLGTRAIGREGDLREVVRAGHA